MRPPPPSLSAVGGLVINVGFFHELRERGGGACALQGGGGGGRRRDVDVHVEVGESVQAGLRLAAVLLDQLDAVSGRERSPHFGQRHAGARGRGRWLGEAGKGVLVGWGAGQKWAFGRHSEGGAC